MKKLFIAALLFIGIASFAQDTDMDQKSNSEPRERLTPEQRNEKHLKKLTSELNLDPKQQEQVKQLLAEKSAKAEKFKEARKDQKETGTKLTADQKKALKDGMVAEKEANDAKMKGILTADQYTKWKANQDENKDKMRERIKERRKEKM